MKYKINGDNSKVIYMQMPDIPDNDKNELNIIRESALPCPFCGSKNLDFFYKTQYGHGDISFENGRICCMDCYGSKGNIHNYGKPTIKDEIEAYKQWNTRK